MWQPIALSDLKIGHFIHLDYAWFSHPFPRNNFRITAQLDIDLLRLHKLTRIRVSPSRSQVAEAANDPPAVIDPGASGAAAEPLTAGAQDAPPLDLAAAKQQRQKQSQGETQRLRVRSERFMEQARELLGAIQQVAGGEDGGLVILAGLVNNAMSIAANPAARLGLVSQGITPLPVPQQGLENCSALAMTSMLANRLQLDEEARRHLAMAMNLHGIGAHKFPAVRQHESGPRDRRQPWHEYPLFGGGLLRRMSVVPREVIEIVEMHRERRDGSGFPRGLSGDAIPMSASIVGLVREYQAMTSDYHLPKPLTPAGALRALYQEGRAAFGERLVETFIAVMTIYPPGTVVELSDGQPAVVLHPNPENRLAPVVLVLGARDDLLQAQVIDLAGVADLKIDRVMAREQLSPAARSLLAEGGRCGVAIDLPPAASEAAAGQPPAAEAEEEAKAEGEFDVPAGGESAAA